MIRKIRKIKKKKKIINKMNKKTNKNKEDIKVFTVVQNIKVHYKHTKMNYSQNNKAKIKIG
jgi:hypothetical protein